MTRKEARELVKAAFATWECEYSTGDDWSKEHEARDMAIKALEQEPKTGHWIMTEHLQGGIKETWYECSECGWNNALVIPRKYCPNCGCKMEVQK